MLFKEIKNENWETNRIYVELRDVFTKLKIDLDKLDQYRSEVHEDPLVVCSLNFN